MTRLPAFVGIATVGRREVLSEVLKELAQQSQRPDGILICPASPADVDEAVASSLPVRVVILPSARGLPHQRNVILDYVRTFPEGLLTFFDDDFLPARNYLAETTKLFQAEPSVVVASGLVLEDGVTGPGLTVTEGRSALARSEVTETPDAIRTLYNAYGCNMSLRLSAVVKQGLQFDEDLPLYGWLEDVDFSRRMASFGRIVHCSRLRGVHLGAKGGRGSGRRTGYSQIANPLHLVRKKTFAPNRALAQIGRNVAANAARSLRPEPWVDRRGRLLGNLLALSDLVRGRLHPRNILHMN